MKGRVNEGECPACGKTVRYCGYVPRIYLCADCGGERPHAEGVVERDGHLYYEPDIEANGGEGRA
jgi:predicted amidophosphoribosyltransferase